MKRLLFIIVMVLCVTASCVENREEIKEAEVVHTNLILAKATFDEMFVNVEKREQNKISEDPFHAVSYPLAKRLDSLKLTFDENEEVEFRNYCNGRFHQKYPYSLD